MSPLARDAPALDLIAVAREFLSELPNPDAWKEALPGWARDHDLVDLVDSLKIACLRVRAFNATAAGTAIARRRRRATR